MKKDYIKAFMLFAVVVAAAVFYYRNITTETVPGEGKYRLANKYLEDGNLQEALDLFNESLTTNPDYPEAYLGKAIALMELKRYDESRTAFDSAIRLNRNFAEAYANRGILNDRTGHYREAIRDYRRALELNPRLAKGPGWLWRFLHNVQERPPTIADRADYLEAELRKPEDKRLLRIPELDKQQRMYRP